MNIWIFNHYAVGPNSIGITRHLDLSKELVKLGHKVTIFASSFNHQKRHEEQSYKDNEFFIFKSYKGVNFCWIKTPGYQKNDVNRVKNILVYSHRLRKIYKKQKERPDIVIGSLMHPLAAILGYRAAKYFSAKFYFEERDLWPQSLIDLGKVSKKNPIVKILSALELFLYKKADKIIVLFEKAPMYVKNRGIRDEKVIYLPNGVDIDRYNDSKKTNSLDVVENYFIKNNDKFNIIYTGAHSLANYLESILDIAEKLQKVDSKISFLFIGDGPDKQNLIDDAKERHLKNVTFLPAVQKEHIPSILKNADAGIIALRDAEVYKWGISLNKMYDYMASGLTIIMFTTLKDTVVEKNKLGIVEDNMEKFIEKIIDLSKNPSMRGKIRDSNLRYVKENHSWEKLALKLHEAFNKE